MFGRRAGAGREALAEDAAELAIETPSEEILRLDAALKRLEEEDPDGAELVLLRYFAGLTINEVAEVLVPPEELYGR